MKMYYLLYKVTQCYRLKSKTILLNKKHQKLWPKYGIEAIDTSLILFF